MSRDVSAQPKWSPASAVPGTPVVFWLMVFFCDVTGPVAEPGTVVTKPALAWPLTFPYGLPNARSAYPSPLKSYGIAVGRAAAWAARTGPVAPNAQTADAASVRARMR